MNRAIIVIRVNNYRPDLCSLTMPNLRYYAERMKADFISVEDRKFPSWPPAYEKLQAYEISKHYDYSLLIDADLALHPRFPDVLSSLPADHCGSWQQYPIVGKDLTLWSLDDPYFRRDNRNLGVVGSFVGCSKDTNEIFKPLDENINPDEICKSIYRPAIIDEYVMSLNVAKYGLKYACLWPSYNGIFHAECTTKNKDEILEKLKEQLEVWNH